MNLLWMAKWLKTLMPFRTILSITIIICILHQVLALLLRTWAPRKRITICSLLFPQMMKSDHVFSQWILGVLRVLMVLMEISFKAAGILLLLVEMSPCVSGNSLNTLGLILVNSNFIVLIPKTPHADSIPQFRPIALGNFLFKIIPKFWLTGWVVLLLKSSLLTRQHLLRAGVFQIVLG